MTNQVNLSIVWGSTGAFTDPGDVNYKEGWLSEIPTLEEFNFLLQALDSNILALAEKGGWVWQADIDYVAGATVITSAGLVAHCKTDNLNQDPATDIAGDYWVSGILFGAAAPNTLTIKDGVLIKDVNPRAATTWDGNDATISNDNALIALNTTGGATANVLIGNVSGSLVAIDVGTTAVPDGRSVALADPNVHLIYHQGNKPTQSDVSGTIPDATSDGKTYARKDAGWVEVTTTVVSETPPTAVGSGTGWYNLTDGQFYVDINDGDSSQWAIANPSVIPAQTAGATSYNDSANGFGSDVQAALDAAISKIGRKNYVINGNFDIWQRGASFTDPNGEYTADRWYADSSLGGGGAGIATKEAFTLGQTDVPGNPEFYYRHDQTTAITSGILTFAAQRIEGVETLANEAVTVSFYAKADSARQLSMRLYQKFGTGGSPSVAVASNTITFDLTTSWEKFYANITLNSVAGKTLGTGGDDSLELQLRNAVIETFTFDIAQVQLEEGSVATDFEYRPVGEELALCQRYFCNPSIPATLNFNGYVNNTVMSWPISFPVTMRATPATSIDSTGWTFQNCDSESFGSQNTTAARLILISTAITANANISGISVGDLTADAEL